MLKTFDIVLIGVMTTAAAVTYTIKHRAELKLEEVHHLESRDQAREGYHRAAEGRLGAGRTAEPPRAVGRQL